MNLKGYTYDGESPKYKLESKGRLKVEKMKSYRRSETYQHKDLKWDIKEDPKTNDFTKLAREIIDSNKSIHIDGRAGTGKSTLIKELQKLIGDKTMYKALAPTNKACRIINGETLHKFVISSNKETLLDKRVKYIIVDEISMVTELFYKFLMAVKKLRPDIKFIIAGDFEQLLPVKDRVEYCNYKDSMALHELCDGRRIQLSKCRRSDDTLFNMLLPNNIRSITKQDFGNKMTNRHICFTNEKRIKINRMMMEKDCKNKRYAKPLQLEALPYGPISQNVKLSLLWLRFGKCVKA